jgi:agmatine deiminase
MASISLPPEWHRHDACWLAWPHMVEEWLDDLEPARRAVAELCAAIADVDPDTGQQRGERIEMLVMDQAGEDSARAALGSTPARYHHIPFGDIWLRDIGPIFGHGPAGVEAMCFDFNGWGGKYLYEPDPEVGRRIAAAAEVPCTAHGWVLEGGSLDWDGEGTVLTTRQCLLNRNRNPDMSQAEVERRLEQSLGLHTVLWLDRGLENDHTDGHIDTLARFVAPARVVCMQASDPDDPNRAVLDQIARDLRGFRDARGRALEIVEIPSPGLVRSASGQIMPASYVNFYIGNRAVAVPTYGTRHDSEALRCIAELFPDRRTVAIDARAVVTGGGAFHCITQQQPGNPDSEPGPDHRTRERP